MVETGILVFQVIQIIIRIEGLAGCFGHDLLRGQTAAVLMNMLFQPAHDLVIMPLGKQFIYIDIFAHGMDELGCVGRTESIGGEVAETCIRPVDILQDAFAVIGDVNTQILLIEFVPGFIQALGGQAAVEETFFDLIEDRSVHRLQCVPEMERPH